MSDNPIWVTANRVVYTDLHDPPYNPLRRPEMNYRHFAIAVIIYILLSAAVSVFAYNTAGIPWYAAYLIFSLIYACVIGKKAAIWLVHLYQNKASDATRLKCVFEPSCSEYMILCIERYGLIIGVWKGWKRLLRCKPPNGGKDYPF